MKLDTFHKRLYIVTNNTLQKALYEIFQIQYQGFFTMQLSELCFLLTVLMMMMIASQGNATSGK